MNYNILQLELIDQVLWITINRESKLNALNRATMAELHTALSGAFDNDEVKGIILTGAGSKAFVAGADISEFLSFNDDQGRALAIEGHTKIFNYIENASKPIIASMNGYALGGGLELAMACHLRIAAEHAQMGLPELSLGLIPGYGGTQRLTHLVGKGKSMEMILTGAMITATEALKIGLVNQVVPAVELNNSANELMQKILSRSPNAVAAAIRAVNAAVSEGKEGYETEVREFAGCFGTPDFKEGTAAFMEKRKPKF